MTDERFLAAGVLIVGLVVMWGIFKTKTPGFGRYSTSVVLLTLVVTIAGLGFAFGRIGEAFFGHVMFAVVGFAGGLIANRQEARNEK